MGKISQWCKVQTTQLNCLLKYIHSIAFQQIKTAEIQHIITYWVLQQL